MNNTIKFSVDRENNGKRLDIFLAKNMSQFTRSFLKKIIENKQVSLNNKILTFPSAKIKFDNNSKLINEIGEPYLIVHQYDKRWSEFSDAINYIKKQLGIRSFL